MQNVTRFFKWVKELAAIVVAFIGDLNTALKLLAKDLELKGILALYFLVLVAVFALMQMGAF